MAEMYRHYKGGLYEKRGEALHTETEEMMVVYANGEGRMFCRPKTMFYGMVETASGEVPRFEKVEE